MQKVISLGVTLFLAVPALANLKSILEQLRTLSKTTNAAEKCAYPFSSANALASIPEMKNCVQLLCPDPQLSLTKTFANVRQSASQPNPEFDKDFLPLIAAEAKADKKKELAVNTSLLQWMKNPVPLTDPKAAQLANFFQTINDIKKFASRPDKNGKSVLDFKGSRSAFPALNDQEYALKFQAAAKIQSLLKEKAFPTTDPIRLQLNFPGPKLDQHIDLVLHDIAKKLAEVGRSVRMEALTQLVGYHEAISFDQLKKDYQSGELNAEQLQQLNSLSAQATVFQAMAKDPELYNLIPLKTSADVVKISQGNELKSRLMDENKKLQAQLSDPKDTDSIYCRAAFASAQEYLPTEADLREFRKRAEEMKASFIAQVKDLRCENMERGLNLEMNSWIASLPQSRESFKKSLRETLQEQLKTTERAGKSVIETLNNSPGKDAVAGIMVAMKAEPKPSEINYAPMSEVDKACARMIPTPLPDATKFGSSNFVVGPLTVKFKDAKGVTYHELSHKLYHGLITGGGCKSNQEWFQKVQKCLAENHTEKGFTAYTQEQMKVLSLRASTYESEDFADLISTHVDNSKNTACIFTRQHDEQEYSRFSLANPSPDDPHSSDLFRLLHIEFLKNGKLPESCERALASRGEKATFKNCFLPLDTK
jgi:hypothetical protein